MQIYTYLYKFIYALYIDVYDYSYMLCKYELDLTEFKRFGYTLQSQACIWFQIHLFPLWFHIFILAMSVLLLVWNSQFIFTLLNDKQSLHMGDYYST
jgi:hypothetical protein